MKFNWKLGVKKSPTGQNKFEALSKNHTELNSSGWKVKKGVNGGLSSDYYNKIKPFMKNVLPPVVLKTTQ